MNYEIILLSKNISNPFDHIETPLSRLVIKYHYKKIGIMQMTKTIGTITHALYIKICISLDERSALYHIHNLLKNSSDIIRYMILKKIHYFIRYHHSLVHINCLDINRVSRFIDESGRIIKRSYTKTSGKDQRKIAKLIKHARFLLLLPNS
ncbi:hypothetical protein [Candidatus Vidania fulgoroideorum]